MFNRQAIGNLTLGGAIILSWVFFTSVYFFFSISYPLLASKSDEISLSLARQEGYNAALPIGQQQGYNIAVGQALQTFSGNVFQNGYDNAIISIATALDAQLQGGCKEAVPVTIGTGSIGILSLACLQQATAQNTPPTEAQPGQ